MQATVVISRGHGEGPQWEMESILGGLCAATPGLKVYLMPHLYHIAEQSAIWAKLAGITERIVFVSWLYSRPAGWVLRAKGIGAGGLRTLCLRDYETAEEAHAAVSDAVRHWAGMGAALNGESEALHIEPEQLDAAAGEGRGLEELAEPVGERWYPVLDSERCEGCQHCLQFCLFGVYELDAAGRVRAANPDNCKAGCPACSRICPQGAIMFPLYAKDAAIAGAPGRLMAPDAAARKMFYLRTKKTCPVCGSTPEAPGRVAEGAGGVANAEGVCAECGRKVEAGAVQRQGGNGPSEADGDGVKDVKGSKANAVASYMKDDLDSLLDDLDQLAKG